MRQEREPIRTCHRALQRAGAVCALLAWAAQAAAADTPRDLAGLWAAKLRFGPDLRGPLTIERAGGAWTAEIAGRRAAVVADGERLSFELANGEGGFRGRIVSRPRPARVEGHWIQPPTVTHGSRYATPIVLEPQSADRWRGDVAPLDDAFTYFLPIRRDSSGTLITWLANPERNLGRFIRVERVQFDGKTVRLEGRPSRSAPMQVVAEGPYSEEDDTFSLPLRGGTCDFHRATAADEEVFRPRGKATGPWVYRRPPAENDGWPVAGLDEAGISREALAPFVQMLMDMPMDSLSAQQIHGMLIARDGNLVLEEYFHGFHRERLHDTRSAAKSITSFLVGAAMQSGIRVSPATRVYEVMDSPATFAALEPRKRALTLENLLTMASGLDIDDSDEKSVGNEEKMTNQQEQPDWYRYTLDLKTVRDPGEKAVYGSASPNLAGGVLAKASGRWLPELFEDLVARPLQIRHYAMNLQPGGEAYMGGGAQITLRDFLKFGQVMIDGGRWHGQPIVSPAWATKSTSRLFEIGSSGYGYLWWVTDLPHQGRTVRAFYAGGNGGQVVMGIPELHLVIGFFGGNYNDNVMFNTQRVYVPKYILPAVK
jgi:CubicO group peptidase (beta-lactamase class C family)